MLFWLFFSKTAEHFAVELMCRPCQMSRKGISEAADSSMSN